MPSIRRAIALVTSTRPSGPASTTPSGSASRASCDMPWMLVPTGSCAGVETDGSRRGEIEALGPAEDRDADPVVGECGELGGQAPGLVAEQPRGGSREQLGGLEQVDLSP